MQPTVTNKSLVKAILIAVTIAVIMLVTVILPAEYNIDPTGAGKAMGLTALSGQTEQSDSAVNGRSQANESKTSAATHSDLVEITIPAGRGIEYKFQMSQYGKMEYEWITNGAPLYFDLHGEPEGDTSGYFESYAIASVSEMKGSFTAPFAGSHGWYWKNNSSEDISIQLMVSGEYSIIGLK